MAYGDTTYAESEYGTQSKADGLVKADGTITEISAADLQSADTATSLTNGSFQNSGTSIERTTEKSVSTDGSIISIGQATTDSSFQASSSTESATIRTTATSIDSILQDADILSSKVEDPLKTESVSTSTTSSQQANSIDLTTGLVQSETNLTQIESNTLSTDAVQRIGSSSDTQSGNSSTSSASITNSFYTSTSNTSITDEPAVAIEESIPTSANTSSLGAASSTKVEKSMRLSGDLS